MVTIVVTTQSCNSGMTNIVWPTEMRPYQKKEKKKKVAYQPNKLGKHIAKKWIWFMTLSSHCRPPPLPPSWLRCSDSAPFLLCIEESLTTFTNRCFWNCMKRPASVLYMSEKHLIPLDFVGTLGMLGRLSCIFPIFSGWSHSLFPPLWQLLWTRGHYVVPNLSACLSLSVTTSRTLLLIHSHSFSASLSKADGSGLSSLNVRFVKKNSQFAPKHWVRVLMWRGSEFVC